MAWFRRAAISATGMLVALMMVGTAIAGNGNANGSANGNGANGAEHAAEAPGQAKKDAAPTPQTGPAATPTIATTVAQTSPSPASPPATAAGVKPSNDTAKNTSCVTGQGSGGASATCTSSASSSKPDSSKSYGNGTTAAQIATSRSGAAVTLKGPGNSQPHKVVACGRRHAVDVHAVKRDSASGCGGTPTPTPTTTPTPDPTPHSSPNPSPHATPSPLTRGGAGDPSKAQAPHVRIGGGPIDLPVRELGDPARRTHKRSTKPASAVLSDVAARVPVLRGTLPFTGFPLWIVVAAAICLIATGAAMRKRPPSPERRKL